jgi:hypothetical protein
MAGLKESLEELRAAWEAIPADKRDAAAEQATVAALMAGDALRIVKDHHQALAGPVVAAATKAISAHMLWKVPIPEILGLLHAVFPGLVAALKKIAHELGFDDEPPPAETPPATP